MNNNKSTKNIWDYNPAKLDLSKKADKLWYYNRQLKFGQLKGLKKTELKKILPQLNISNGFKKLLANFLNQHA